MTTLAVLVIFQPFVDLAEAIIKFFAETIGLSWGLVDRHADPDRAAVHAAAVAHRDPLDAPHAAGRAGAQGGSGEVQGRPRAPAARDARPLQGARGQPARLLLSVPAPDPVLHRRLLAAARRHLPAGRRVERRRGQLPLRPGHPDPARGRREVGADRAVHQHHGAHVPLHDGDDADDDRAPELHLPRAAVAVRPGDRQPAGRPRDLLDHHQPLEPRPAGGRAAGSCRCRLRRRRRRRKKAEPPPPPPRKKKKRR